MTPVQFQNSGVKDWRGLYNRTKHADRDPKDLNMYLKGIEELGIDYIIPVRRLLHKNFGRFFTVPNIGGLLVNRPNSCQEIQTPIL